jgi:hypothetical protein
MQMRLKLWARPLPRGWTQTAPAWAVSQRQRQGKPGIPATWLIRLIIVPVTLEIEVGVLLGYFEKVANLRPNKIQVRFEWLLLKRMCPGVFDPRCAVNRSLVARLRHPCRRRPRIEHTGAWQITAVALSKCHWVQV